MWDNKYLLLFKKWDRHRGKLKGILKMKMIWDKEMQKMKGGKKCTHMTKYKIYDYLLSKAVFVM